MNAQEYVDMVTSEIDKYLALYEEGVISLDDFNSTVDSLVSLERISKTFPNHKEREMAEDLIAAILDVNHL